jgi:uncharacterized membrane protein
VRIHFPRPALVLALAVGTAFAVRRLRSERAPQFRDENGRPFTVRHRITIYRPPAVVYAAWSALERLPRFMPGLASVRAENGRSHWVAVTPGGRPFEWEMHTVDAQEGALLVWRSSGALAMCITARFDPAPADRGTELTLTAEFAPVTALAGVVARAAGTELREVLRRFKQWVEAGEVATVEGQPTGRAAEVQRVELRKPAAGRSPKDAVERASAQSFPASDPPASGVVR